MRHTNVVETLRDPEVRKYFLGILGSPLLDEDKLEKFVAFFDLQARLEERIAVLGSGEDIKSPDKLAEIVSTAGQQIGAWQPKRILEQTADCVARAAGRILRCQRPDGGWGYGNEPANLWGAAQCVTALSLLVEATDDLPLPRNEVRERVRRGSAWIEGWFGGPGQAPDASTYDAALAVRCFHRIGRADFSPVSAYLERLRRAQNPDGGWDWSFPESRPSERRSSEVGATGMVLEALSVGNGESFRAAIEKGMCWLAGAQNRDGSWNEVFKDEPHLRGSINKTCDALSGLNAGRKFGLTAKYRTHIDRGVMWISEQEKLIGDGAWGYEGLLTADIISTCIVLETLLKIENVSLALLSANAQWLVSNQHREPGAPEDGEWIGGDTYRIALALTDYLTSIRESPLFRLRTDETSASSKGSHPKRRQASAD